ncbi:MAG: glycosyltransferase family 2 protein [bacterium]|nr:glycosyltransferase family 2 protein [bacterium]
MKNLSVVINTINAQDTIERALTSVKDLGEIYIIDMYSDDKTVEIAKRFTSNIFMHERVGYVEPAREFAISKAQTEWIFVLDADEEVSPGLKSIILQIASGTYNSGVVDPSHYYIPRKTFIFNQWMYHSGWWPDEKIRLFKQGTVQWPVKIHADLVTTGNGAHLPLDEVNSIIHYHYNSVYEWVERMNRYSTIQATEKVEEGYKFSWNDLIRKPLSEFLRRFFVWDGWKDGVVGLGICLMQAFSEVVVYMKIRDMEIKKGMQIENNPENFLQSVGEEIDASEVEVGFYLEKLGLQSQLKRWIQKVLP